MYIQASLRELSYKVCACVCVHTRTCVHAVNNNKGKNMTLRGIGWGMWKGLKGGNGDGKWCNWILICKIAKKRNKIC